jgi:hypothetical protein
LRLRHTGAKLFGDVQHDEESMAATTVNVRYMVDDVDAAVAWYTKHLGFTLLSNAAPAFADVTLGSLRLLLSGPKSSAGRPMPDAEVARLRAAGVEFRNDIVTGPGRIADPAEGPLRQSRRTVSTSPPLTARVQHRTPMTQLKGRRQS